MLMTIILCVISYLIGSIPTAYWFIKLFYKRDIRKIGSGNSGASNTFRNFGILATLPVLIIDILKGYLAANLSSNINIQFFIVLSAIIGHIFSIFSDFKGGKGVAISLGCLITINSQLLIIPVSLFILSLMIWRIASLSSIISIYSLLISSIIFNREPVVSFLAFFIFFLILLAHRENVDRLINGEEKKLF